MSDSQDLLTKSELVASLPELQSRILEASKRSCGGYCMCRNDGAAWQEVTEFLQEKLSGEQIFMVKKLSSHLNNIRWVDERGIDKDPNATSGDRLYVPDKRMKCAELEEFLPEFTRRTLAWSAFLYFADIISF